jgi:hypothetical protein
MTEQKKPAARRKPAAKPVEVVAEAAVEVAVEAEAVVEVQEEVVSEVEVEEAELPVVAEVAVEATEEELEVLTPEGDEQANAGSFANTSVAGSTRKTPLMTGVLYTDGTSGAGLDDRDALKRAYPNF